MGNRNKGTIDLRYCRKTEGVFDWETFLGMCLLPDITHSNLESASHLIEFVQEMPERVLLIHFIYSGYGPRMGTVDMDTFDKIMKNDRDMLLFVSNDMSFSTERKAILFEMLSHPERTKEDLLYLLEWFYENVFSTIEPRIAKIHSKAVNEIEREISATGEKFLRTIIKTSTSLVVKYQRGPLSVPVISRNSLFQTPVSLCKRRYVHHRLSLQRSNGSS